MTVMRKKRRSTRKNRRNPGRLLLDFFYTIFVGKNKDIKNVRRVYFGLNIRIITVLSLIFLLMISIMSGVLYLLEINEVTLSDIHQSLSDLPIRPEGVGPAEIFFIFSATLLLLILVIISVVIRRFLKHLKILQEGALEFGKGRFDTRIDIKPNDEIGRLADILNNMASVVKEKLSMEKFISRSTKTMIKKSETSGITISPGTLRRGELSFIFADVRGFTSFAEENSPETVVETLNRYFNLQYKVIRRHGGDVDDYVGDQIMAHFTGKNHKFRACVAAIEIMKEIRAFNSKMKRQGDTFFDIGVGVHSGLVVTGNIGTSRRMDFACIGDAVNTTSRICSHANPGEILVSYQHIQAFTDTFKITRMMSLKVKGKKEKIVVMRLIDIR